MTRPSGYWTPERVDTAFDQLMGELGRVPKFVEFQERFVGALNVITKGRYRGVGKGYMNYLKHRDLYTEKWVDSPERIDAAFDQLMGELGRVPTGKEFAKRFGGASHAIKKGRYNQKVEKWTDYLKHRGLNVKESKPDGYWNGQENIDAAFNGMMKKLGRIPTHREFSTEFKGAMIAITEGRYRPDIKGWTDYLKHMDMYVDKRWVDNPENVDRAFDNLMEKLGRVPTTKDIQERHSGVWAAITRGRYRPGVRTWTAYLKHRGLYDKWVDNPEKVDTAFDELREELGRAPTYTEMKTRLSGALSAIENGKYRLDVKNWKTYMKHRGIAVKDKKPNGYWNPERVDRTFYELMEKLGRLPTAKELAAKHGGAVGNIYLGKYHPKVKNYGDYLKHKGLYDGGWMDPKNVDAAFDQIMEELGRIPMQKEFRLRYGGAMNAIVRGRYHPQIKNYTLYLKHRGLYNGRIRTPTQLKDIFNTEPKARYAVKLAHGNEADLADILAVVYEGRLSREDALRFMDSPSLRDYLGRFRKPDRISDVIEPVQELLPLDKNNVIKGIMKKRLTAYRAEKLGPNPTDERIEAFKKELEDELGKLGE